MDYGKVSWDPCTKQDIQKLENVQRSATRFIMKDYHSRQERFVTEMLHVFKLPTLKDRRRDQRLTLMYKVVEGHLPAINRNHYIQPQRKRRAIRLLDSQNMSIKTLSKNILPIIKSASNQSQLKQKFSKTHSLLEQCL